MAGSIYHISLFLEAHYSDAHPELRSAVLKHQITVLGGTMGILNTNFDRSLYVTDQLDSVAESSDIQSNIIPGVSVQMFSMELTFEAVDIVKQIALPSVGGLI